MTTRLDIGPEALNPDDMPEASPHLLNLSQVDAQKQAEARAKATLDVKDIKAKRKKEKGRICVVGELPRDKQGLGRAPVIAAAIAMILLLNLGQMVFLGKHKGGEALALAGEAFTTLKDASGSITGGEVGADLILFEEAGQLFIEAEEKSQFLLKTQSEWLPEPSDVTSLRKLLEAGQLMAEVGQHLGRARVSFTELPEEGSLTDLIRQVSESELEPAAQKLATIQDNLTQVDLSGTPYASDFILFQESLNALADLFEVWLDAKEPLLTMLGDRYPQRYLVLLMNNDEMRPGGGFIGSYVLLDLNEGRLSNWSFHDVYDLDNSYTKHHDVPAPELQHLTKEWRLRDSNIYPDFTLSAEQAAWFLEAEGGPGVDGVLAVNLSTAQSLLEVLKEVQVDSISTPITAENFTPIMSTLVEAKVYGATSPKEILNQTLSAILEQSTDFNTKAQLGLALYNDAHKKQVLLYHKDASAQAFLEDLGIAGQLPDLASLEHDFFMPIFTNMGANKTDRYIHTDIQHHTEVLSDGGLVDRITIQRTHTFNDATLAWLKDVTAKAGFTAWNSHLEQLMGKGVNRTGIRLYLPEGIEILGTEGILRDEIQFLYDPTLDLSYYFIDQSLAPGQSQEFSLVYALPFGIDTRFTEYQASLFKQPGLKNLTLTKTANANDSLLLKGYPAGTTAPELDYSYTSSFESDEHFDLLYK